MFGCVQKSTKQDICYYCNAYIYVRYYQFSMLSLIFVLVYWQVFCRAHRPDRPVNLMKIPHDSAAVACAAQFYETDIELLDGKVMMEQFMPSVASSWPRKLSIGLFVTLPAPTSKTGALAKAFSQGKPLQGRIRYIICQVYVIHILLCRYRYVTHIEV
jgi:hypothetical protein